MVGVESTCEKARGLADSQYSVNTHLLFPVEGSWQEPSLRTSLAPTDVLPRRDSGDGCTYRTGKECSRRKEAWPEGSNLSSLRARGEQRCSAAIPGSSLS